MDSNQNRKYYWHIREDVMHRSEPLNNAVWKFLDAWDLEKQGRLTGKLALSVKSILRIAIQEYLDSCDETENSLPKTHGIYGTSTIAKNVLKKIEESRAFGGMNHVSL